MKRIVFFVFLCMVSTMCLNDSSDTPQATVVREKQSPGGSIEQIIVVHFHRVHQCTCCINVGKWAEETIQNHFPDEYESGKIVYMDVCVEENRELARKYNAYGASLFINVVKDSNENITENMIVWQYCFDHDNYVAYFKQLLESLLGG